MRTRARHMLAAAAAGASVLVGLPATTADAAATWASATSATVHPGVTVTIGGVKCLAGFVLRDHRRVFLTTTAGCAGVSPGEAVNGCSQRESAGVDPVGIDATVQGAKYPATYVYNSFAYLKLHPKLQTANRCQYDSLALVQLDRRDVKRVNPSIPTAGGPETLAKSQPAAPDMLTAFLPTATTAHAIETNSGGWAHTAMVDGHVSATTAGAPVVTDSGAALGMVTVIPPQGTVGETTVSDLRHELRLLHRMSRFEHVHLVPGTEDYVGAGLPLTR